MSNAEYDLAIEELISNPDYKIHEDGIIETLITQSGNRSVCGVWRKLGSENKRFLRITYRYKKLLVPRIVYRKFIGTLPVDSIIIHKDGNIKNNHFTNLGLPEQKFNFDFQVCYGCKEQKPLGEFSFKNKKEDKRNLNCKNCHNTYVRNHYQENKETYYKKAKKRQKEVITRNREFIISYLETHPCVDCGETDIQVLEFDHLADKKHNISQMIPGGFALPSYSRRNSEMCS